MNKVHQIYCDSARWRDEMVGRILPWVLDGIDLDGPVLEIGPGPGLVTEALVQFGVEDLTSLEIEPEAAERLRDLYDSRVRVETGDASSMPFDDASFATVVCCTMLHHVPTVDAQDAVLAESRRVLTPGGVIAGSDSITSMRFRLFHLFDVHNPVDPASLPDRLRAAGFDHIEVEPAKGSFRFRAITPT
jgi:ubiquinone/menaquinone biosynthesis C-methylase UbiE